MAAITVSSFLSFLFVFIVCFQPNRGGRKGDQRSTNDDEFLGSTYSSESVVIIEHSFDSGTNVKYSHRGSLNFRSMKPGVGTFTQASALTAGEKRKLKELAKSDGLYRIRVAGKFGVQAETEENGYVSTFTKASGLVESRLSDHITVHADQSGNIMGVSVRALRLTWNGLESEAAALNYFNTTVSLDVTVPGPTPDTQAYVQKIEEERMHKVKGTSADNRSFFAKYWMYIVPVVIFVMMSSGGGGGGGSS